MVEGLFIPLDKTIHDFQKMLKCSALTGELKITPADIINQIQHEPIYNVNDVIRDVMYALVSDNENKNCLTGDDTERVIVDRAKLEEVLDIIEKGGVNNACKPRPRPCT